MGPEQARRRRAGPRRGPGPAAWVLALPVALVLSPGAAAAELGPQDMAAMMQGMAAMMKLWNAFSSGSGTTDLSGLFPPRSGLDGGSWVDPWGSSAWSTVPGTGGGGWSSPWSGLSPMPGSGWPVTGGGVPGGGWLLPGGATPGGWPLPGPRVPGVPWTRPTRTVTTLEGKWQGANGEWLEFRGDRFRLAAADGGSLSGSFLLHGDRLVAYVPQADVTRRYRFEVRGEYLALMDEAGQILLFRRAP